MLQAISSAILEEFWRLVQSCPEVQELVVYGQLVSAILSSAFFDYQSLTNSKQNCYSCCFCNVISVWLLGNLARATYVGSSEYIWPYSYNKCDETNRLSQAISACSRVNHFGLQEFRGRGAPEIDLIEAMQGEADPMQSTSITKPYQSCSFQVALVRMSIDRYLERYRNKGTGILVWTTTMVPSLNQNLIPFFMGFS